MILALAALCAAVAAPSAASAQDYPPPAVSAPTKAVAGEDTPFTGSGFKGDSTVTVSVTYGGSNSTAGHRASNTGGVVMAGLPTLKAVVKTVVTNSSGAFSTTVKLTQSGTATISGTGVDPAGVARTVSATVVVAASSSSGNNSQLAVTGQDGRLLATQVGLGLAAVLVGAVMIWMTVAWRRRSVRSV